jgi:hypothetical protein
MMRRRAASKRRPRPDYLKIAVLEYEQLGIRPAPGTAAEAAVNLALALGQIEAPHSAEPSGGIVGAPRPVSLEPGEWILPAKPSPQNGS